MSLLWCTHNVCLKYNTEDVRHLNYESFQLNAGRFVEKLPLFNGGKTLPGKGSNFSMI